MRIKYVINLILFAGVFALAIIAVVEPGIEPLMENPLLRIDRNSITRIEINRDQHRDIVLEQIKNRWLMTQPLQTAADPKIVKQLLKIPTSTSKAEYRVGPGELAKYGLEKPKITLTLNDHKLRFGGTDPVNSRRYVAVNHKLKLVTDTFYHHLIASAPHFTVKDNAESNYSAHP